MDAPLPTSNILLLSGLFAQYVRLPCSVEETVKLAAETVKTANKAFPFVLTPPEMTGGRGGLPSVEVRAFAFGADDRGSKPSDDPAATVSWSEKIPKLDVASNQILADEAFQGQE